jgi:hypothetical protein
MTHVQTYEKSLKQVFTDDDPELAARVARVCVLFEDLRVEYWGAHEDGPLPLDKLGIEYRRFYFLRRSLVTLDEFAGAINRLNALQSWSDRIENHESEEQRKIWNEAIAFFEQAKERFAKLRNDIGGHYQEKSATYAVGSMTANTTGRFDIEVEGDGADTKLHFATELVTRLLVKDMPADEDSTDEKLQAYIGTLFREVFDGWGHVISAVHVVAAAYLAPRFIKGGRLSYR